MTKSKFAKIAGLVAIICLIVFGGLMFGGCGGGSVAPTVEQIEGTRWELTRVRTRESSSMGTSSVTIGPRSALWTSGYFIEFDVGGAYRESDFWNGIGGAVTSQGTWVLDDEGNLTLVRTGGGSLIFNFVGNRTVSINGAGNRLTMTYTRIQSVPGFGSVTWNYTHTFRLVF